MKHYKNEIKKSSMYFFMFLMCTFLCISACMKNNTLNDEIENVMSENKSPTSKPETTAHKTEDIKVTTTTKLMPEAYNIILHNIVNAYPWGAFDEINAVPENPELSYMYRKSDSLSDIGFALVDLDNNGQEELIITDINCPYIYDLYTISDGKATHLFDSGERYCYYIYENGYIKNQWSSSAVTNGNDFYKLEDGVLKLVERITLDEYHALDIGLIKEIAEADGTHYFNSKTTQMDDYKPITLEEYKHTLETYEKANKPLEIEYTLLSEY